MFLPTASNAEIRYGLAGSIPGLVANGTFLTTGTPQGVSATGVKTFFSSLTIVGANLEITPAANTHLVNFNQGAFCSKDFPLACLLFDVTLGGYSLTNSLGAKDHHFSAVTTPGYTNNHFSVGKTGTLGSALEVEGDDDLDSSASLFSSNASYTHFLAFTNGGKLGIDTTIPKITLEVNGGMSAGLGPSKSTFMPSGALFINSGSSITQSGANGFFTSKSSVNASAFFGDGGNIDNVVHLTGDQYVAGSKTFSDNLFTNKNTYLGADGSGGFVGINNSGPSFNLDVVGNSGFGTPGSQSYFDEFGGLNIATDMSIVMSGQGYIQTTSSINTSGIFATSLRADQYVDFPHQPTPGTVAAGVARLHGNTTQGFTRLQIDDEGSTDIELSRDNAIVVRNDANRTVQKGEAVYISGSVGAIPTVKPALATSSGTMPAIGLVLDSITSGAFGRVMTGGIITSTNTNLWPSGTQLYVSPFSSGSWVSSRPVVPHLAQRVGTVLVSNVAAGSIGVVIAPFLGGIESGTLSTYTVKGNAFSVGGSSFSVTGGSVTVAYQINTNGIVTTNAPAASTTRNPGSFIPPFVSTAAFLNASVTMGEMFNTWDYAQTFYRVCIATKTGTSTLNNYLVIYSSMQPNGLEGSKCK